MNQSSQTPSQRNPAPRRAPLEAACHAFALSHKGHVRENNEDQYLIANLTSAMQVVSASMCESRVYFGSAPSSLFAVADGMGGHAKGEHASALALCSVENFILRTLGRVTPFGFQQAQELLKACFQTADATVFGSSERDAELRGMGTTMTLALLSGNELHLAHAGDSRAYLLRKGTLYRLTRDHTVAGELAGQGIINAQEAEEHPLRHVVTNFVGGGHLGVSPDLAQIQVNVGDRVLLATDGLTDLVNEESLKEILAAELSPETSAGRLVDAAFAAGGPDNVTALVVTFAAMA